MWKSCCCCCCCCTIRSISWHRSRTNFTTSSSRSSSTSQTTVTSGYLVEAPSREITHIHTRSCPMTSNMNSIRILPNWIYSRIIYRYLPPSHVHWKCRSNNSSSKYCYCVNVSMQYKESVMGQILYFIERIWMMMIIIMIPNRHCCLWRVYCSVH